MKLFPIAMLAGAVLAAAPLSAGVPEKPEGALRVALFNIRELSTEKLLEAGPDGAGTNAQAAAAAAIIQRVRPDVLAINEIDHDYEHPGDLEINGRRFIDHYLNRGEDAISYPHIYAAPCNTGILSGIDLNSDGTAATAEHQGRREHGDDSYGFGTYPGQYSMMLFSMHPIDAEKARTFQTFLWKDMPGNLIPPSHYSDDATAVFRLSSKSHWDVPVLVNGTPIHFLMSHPTPQSFDGPEDRNGRRNYDEIRLWAEYLNGAPWIYDDAGRKGGLAKDARFVLLGDQNAGPGIDGAIRYNGRNAWELLTEHPRILDTTPIMTGAGGRERFGSESEGAAQYTYGWYGGSRIDYILPDADAKVAQAGIFWPSRGREEEAYFLAERASDHYLLWLDLEVAAAE